MDAETVLRFVVACAVIAGALYLFAFVAKRGTLRPGSFLRRERLVEVIETTPLPHASALHVIKVADAYYVIGRTDHGISLVSEIPTAAVQRAQATRPKPGAFVAPWLPHRMADTDAGAK